MYKVRFFRIGSYNNFNRKAKGVFVKRFETIDDVVKEFIKQRPPKIAFYSIREDLGEEGFRVFEDKIEAKWRKSAKKES